jgi:hypothetical protein
VAAFFEIAGCFAVKLLILFDFEQACSYPHSRASGRSANRPLLLTVYMAH